MSDVDSRWLELRTAFRGELEERLTTLNTLLVQLEAQRGDDQQHAETLRTLYREAHSLKGAARAVELPRVERLEHALESLLDCAAGAGRRLSSGWYAAGFRALDALAAPDERQSADWSDVIAELERQAADPAEEVAVPMQRDESANVAARTAAPESVRVAVDKLDALLAQAGELAVTHIRIEQRQRELRQHLSALLRLVGRTDERALGAL